MHPDDMDRFRFSTRRNALLFLASFFMAVGLGGGGWPVAAAGLTLFILMIQQYVLDSPVIHRLRIRRRHTPRAFESARVHLDITIENPAGSHRSPASLVALRDRLQASTPSEILCQTALIRPGNRVHFRTRQTITRKRGLHIVGPIRLYSRDSLGLFTFRRTVDLLTRLTVVPRTHPVPNLSLVHRGTTPDVGRDLLAHPARSQEFRTLRPYQPGDPPRLIHWLSSARYPVPMVKEFHAAIETDVWIITDLFLPGITGLADRSSGEIRLIITASLVSHALARGHRTLTIVAKGDPDETTLGTGRRHLEATLDWLGILKPDGSQSFEPHLIQAIPRIRRGATLYLVLSSLHTKGPKLQAALGLLRPRGITPIVLILEDRELQKLRPEQDQTWYTNPTAGEFAMTLLEQGIRAYPLSSREPIAPQLNLLGLPAPPPIPKKA